jgi:uncharacterized protein YbbK (DUF523 family)
LTDIPAAPPPPIRVGISSCLLGEEVRFDGGHKRDSFLTQLVGRFVEFVPSCPEVEVGMGTPRESLRLHRIEGDVRMVTVKTERDYTDPMRAYSRERARQLAGLGLSGYILKSKSPSCGMERVKVYDANSVPASTGRGLFAEELMRALPWLPVEEEGRLNDPALREHYFERVFAVYRVDRLLASEWTLGELVRFHSDEKLLLLAHDPQTYRALGRLVAGARGLDRDQVAEEYRKLFLGALARPASVRRHLNVLQHLIGYF